MYDQVSQNKRRSILLIAGFIVVVVLVGFAIDVLAGYGAVWIIGALIVAGVSAFLAYWKSDAIALAVSRARPATKDEFPRLHNIV